MWLQPNYFWMILKVKLLQSMISEAKSSCKGVGAGEKEKTIMWRVVKGHGGNNNKLLTAGYCTLCSWNVGTRKRKEAEGHEKCCLHFFRHCSNCEMCSWEVSSFVHRLSASQRQAEHSILVQRHQHFQQGNVSQLQKEPVQHTGLQHQGGAAPEK